MKFDIPSHLSDDDLVSQVKMLVRSEPAAYNRIEAARAARRFPAIVRMLGEGSLSLATVRLLTCDLTAENEHELLAAAAGKSKRQVEEMLAGQFPKPAVPSLVRKLAPDRYEIRLTASAQTREKLRQAQDMLRHAIPNGDLGEVIDRALTVLLEDLARKKFAGTSRPRACRGTKPGGRYIAAKVRRVAWSRDGGACAFVSKSGRRCNERAFVEFHHIDPHGGGGEATIEKTRLLCRAHNNYEGELFYGHGRPVERRTLPGKSPAPP